MSRRLLAFAAIVSLAAACTPGDAGIRRERLLAERRSLEATFDRLEQRMLANQARVRLWQELRARHESITAVACASQAEHAEDMARFAVSDEARRAGRHGSLDRARVASVPASAEPPLRAAR